MQQIRGFHVLDTARVLARIATSLAIIGAAVAAAFWLTNSRPPVVASSAPAADPLVRVAIAAAHDGPLTIPSDGVVVPFREIELAAEVAGRIVEKSDFCRAGRFVAAGSVLLRIDPRDYELEVSRLSAVMDQATASLRELEVEISNTQQLIELAVQDLELQRRELKRLEQLERQVVTDSDLDRARRAEISSRNAVLSWENQLSLLQTRRTRLASARELAAADKAKAQLDLARTEILAPFDGVIVQESVERESYVQRGTPLLKLEDTAAAEVRTRLRMEDLAWVWRQAGAAAAPRARDLRDEYELPPAPVTIIYRMTGNGNSEYAWRGTLSRYDGFGVDEKTRTAPCRVLVAAPREVAVRSAVVRSEPHQTRAATDTRTATSTGLPDAANATEPAAATVPPPAGSATPPALVRGMFVNVEIELPAPAGTIRVPENALRPGKSLWVVRDGAVKNMADAKVIQATRDDRGSYWLIDGQASGIRAGEHVIVPPFPVLVEGMRVQEQPLGNRADSSQTDSLSEKGSDPLEAAAGEGQTPFRTGSDSP